MSNLQGYENIKRLKLEGNPQNKSKTPSKTAIIEKIGVGTKANIEYEKFQEQKNRKVAIRNEYLKVLPFNLKTWNGVTIILSFWGDDIAVEKLMQKISHSTRAYFIYSNRLKGSLVLSVTTVLEDAEQNGELCDMA